MQLFLKKIRKGLFIGLIGLLCSVLVRAQNLIPDPSFDFLASTECIWPGDVWPSSAFWYVANPTPDWYVNGCEPFPNFPYWDFSQGTGEAGFRMDLRVRGFHYSEAFGTPLASTMEAGELYYFEMEIRNRGIYLIQGNSFGADCTITPQKDVRVYTASDSIFFIIDELNNGAVTTNATELFQFQQDFLASSEESFATKLGECLIGDPSVTHLAIAPRFGTFEVAPPCELIDSMGVFNIAYYALDNVHLHKLPERIDTSVLWCLSDPDQFIDLAEIFDERALRSVNYRWADGTVGAVRTFEQAGWYEATIELSCGSIPVRVEVAYESCAINVYVPNAFSPNNDGINDTFGPFIEADFPITGFSLKIYDRWGGLLFESQSMNDAWNGEAFGDAAKSGVYVWVLEYEVSNADDTSTFKEMGEVLVIR
ncbi:MAG: gliding motility-associated C-terminal domain-containing protein [Bacteroidota bacterium]